MMRIQIQSILKATAVLALLAGSATAAMAETTPADAKAKTCQGLDQAACQAPDCQWIDATKTKAGKDVKAYCRKVAKKKADTTTPKAQ